MTKIDKRGGFGLLRIVVGTVAIALGAACGDSEVTPPAPVIPVDASVPDSALPFDASVPDSAPPVDASVVDSAPACSSDTFAAKVDYATGIGPAGVAVGDFNGDQKPDLSVANYGAENGTTVSVLLGNGNGTFAAKVDYITGTAPGDIAIGDFNGDQKPDLAVTNNGSATLSVLLNQCK